ncbi:MAG: beta galactosidase jelly roll domain-containing protein, partial [Phycisphaerales bacterium]
MPSLRPALAAIVLAAATSPALATVSMPAIFSDGMVLQRGEAAFWGFARPGERIVVEGSWGGRVETVGDERGRFMAMLPTGEAGGPFGVKISGENEIAIRDVLVGEVWLASGQSNMEQKVAPPSYNGVENWRAEVATADFPSIRFFDVQNAIAATPRSNVSGSWVAVSPRTAGSLSAVAFFFARDVHQALGVPVGVITTDWGGTRIEAWMSPESLAPFKEYAGELEYLAMIADPARRAEATAGLEEQWWNDLDAKAPGGNAWKTAGYDASNWASMDLPTTLSGEYGDFDGMLYFRRTVELPQDWDPQAAATLELGPIDDEDDAFVNGVAVGSTHGDGKWAQPRKYDIPSGTLKPGTNVIAVRMVDNAGPGGINGNAEQMRIVAGER